MLSGAAPLSYKCMWQALTFEITACALSSMFAVTPPSSPTLATTRFHDIYLFREEVAEKHREAFKLQMPHM